MQPYQEEYIASLKDISALRTRKHPGNLSFDEYLEEVFRDRMQAEQKIKRNMELLRGELFPVLDHIHNISEDKLQELREFADALLYENGRDALDAGLFCQIHKALLTLSRLTRDRNAMIRELYWLGMAHNNQCNKLVGLDLSITDKYTSQMRLCFTEAAAYLKYYDEIDDTETRGYILRSRANMSLGKFRSASEKIHMIKRSLEILQDKDYQEKAPDLPWDKYIYLTHQQMAASISHSRETTMTSADVTDIMESVYIVHERRFQEADARNEHPPIRPRFAYYAIEYYCGLNSLDGLLNKMELLMDKADLTDFSTDSMYGIISLPAFYCQYLNDYPERIPKRTEYLESLYHRILKYMDSVPDDSQNETLFLYLRQLSSTFLETENSISYKEFLIKVQMRFAPEIFVHSWAVGKGAVTLCRIILEEEPEFFDDAAMFRAISDPTEKKQCILNYAMEAGMLHDIGKVNFINLYSQAGRQWFEEEYEMAHLHTLAGEAALSARNSTRPYAAIAHGHHSWYDCAHGYPDSYHRLECQYRQMTDLIGLIDWLHDITDMQRLYMGFEKTFEEAIEDAIALGGKRFSPLLTVRLQDERTTSQLKTAFTEGCCEAYRQIYDGMKS